MNSPHEVIIRPIVTERSFDQMSLNKYSFEVARSAPKEKSPLLSRRSSTFT